MKFLLRILQGGLIGIAMVIPGFSGGTIAVLSGIYDDLIEAISGFRKHWKESISVLLPLIIGIAIFAIAFIFPITWGINNYPFITVSLFAGLLIGGLPSFYQNIKGKNNPINITSLIFGVALVLALTIPSLFAGDRYVPLGDIDWYMYLLLFVIGVVASAALVVPGISGSMFLLLIGFYNPIMDMIKAFIGSLLSVMGINIDVGLSPSFVGNVDGNMILPSFLVCLCFGLGIIVGFILISKLMKYLLSKHRDATFFAIFGFITASLIGIYADASYYQNLDFVQIILAVVFLAIGAAGSYFALIFAEKKKNKNLEMTVEEVNNNEEK